MLAQLDELYAESLEKLKQAEATAVLDTWYKETLGRKGSIYLMTRQVGQLSAEERPVFGKRINAVKQELEAAYEQRLAELKAVELKAQMASSAIDVTLPGRKQWRGALASRHPNLARNLPHLGRHGLPGLPQPRCGNRRVQL